MRREQKRKRKRRLGRRKQRRNRRFWKRVVANRYTRILETARRFTKNVSDAQDLAQTVILRLLKYCPKPVRIVNLDAYIYVSTKHVFLDSQRRPHKEISFSELKKTDVPQTAVSDPKINSFLATCDLRKLEAKAESNEAKLLQTKIWIGAGLKLPHIAKLLNEPVRRTRSRWYRYRDTQQKALRDLCSKELSSSKLH